MISVKESSSVLSAFFVVKNRVALIGAVCPVLFWSANQAAAAERNALFDVPDFRTLPPAVEVVSEKTDNGVKLTELYFAGAPFNGKPTRIYGFYARPEADGRYPGVVQLHGAGLQTLTPDGALVYARNGYACISIDWCGPAKDRKEPRKPPYSEFESAGTMASPALDPATGEALKTKPWVGVAPEQSGITNGVRFVRRAFQFLRSRPEVDPDKLCLSGMSAGAHLSLLVLGVEPTVKAAAVKYGEGYIRDLPGLYGGYFGPITLAAREQQDAWLAVLDPKHGMANYKASVLLLSGTDDIFFWMPIVLHTYRQIPGDKRLLMLPNDNHSQVGNEELPLRYFKSVLGTAPAWRTIANPLVATAGDKLKLQVPTADTKAVKKVSFWVKRMPAATFRWGMGDKDKPETNVKWTEFPATLAGDSWAVEVPAPAPAEQVVAYAMAEDEAGNKVSSDTVEAPLFRKWRGWPEPWELTKKAGEFDRAKLSDPERLAAVRQSGNLAGKVKPDDPWKPVSGWFEYDFSVPLGAWHEILVQPQADNQEYVLDGKEYVYASSSGPKVGNFWLAGGKHTLQIRREHWTGMAAITGFTVRTSAPDLGKTVRIEAASGRVLIRKGENLHLTVNAGGRPAPARLNARIMDAGVWPWKPVGVFPLDLPVSAEPQTLTLTVPCPQEGTFVATFADGDREIPATELRHIRFSVVDTAPAPRTGGDIQKKLLQEIDCAATPPDYTGGGDTRLITKPFGRYRESGDRGWLQYMNSTDPSWFAYAVQVPEPQRLYVVEVDYPDDALRTYCIAVREGAPEAYPTAGGVDSGGEFLLSHQMQTHTLLHWARGKDLRVVMLTAQTGRRAATARIRVYQVEGELPLPQLPTAGGRTFSNWYEEGSNFVAMYGAPNRDVPGLLTAADRWARTVAYTGGNNLWMTVAVYQFGLYPTRYNVNFGSLYSNDLVRQVLLKCEKYGMGFIGEFHPEARELDWPSNADPARLHLAISRYGKTKTKATEPLYNPLWPANREWYLGMIGEFADRYQDSPAFRGVCLRLMSWVNPGLNNFHSLDWGYDDFTVSLFERETGRSIPVPAGDPERFGKRYDWLMANARDAWIDWRCAKITELYRQVRDRVRQARPDLVVYSNWCFEDAPREVGIDPIKLQQLDGVVLIGGASYGRRQHRELEVQAARDNMLDPAALRAMAVPKRPTALIFGAGYFEATELVATPEAIGFPKTTKATWMSGVVNPVGRGSLERWAVGLAETDATFLADGGNAYTIGQPILRDWLREYRSLPAVPFADVTSNQDMVVARFAKVSGVSVQVSEMGTGDTGLRTQDSGKTGSGSLPSTLHPPPSTASLRPEHRTPITDHFFFYLVNRERYPVTVSCELRKADGLRRLGTGETVKVKGKTLELVLQPFELAAFVAPAKARITKLTATVPPDARQLVENQVAFLTDLAAQVQGATLATALPEASAKRLTAAAAEAAECLKEDRLWRARTLIEHHDLLQFYQKLNRFPPALRDNGAPVAPEGALKTSELRSHLATPDAGTVVASETVLPEWAADQLLTTEKEILPLRLTVPMDATYRLQVGLATGGEFGKLAVVANGTERGTLGMPSGNRQSVAITLPAALVLPKGEVSLDLKRVGGARTALSFVSLEPVYRDLTARHWQVVGPFMIPGAEDSKTGGAAIEKAMRETVYPPEEKRDFQADVALGNGKTARWVRLTGDGDFVNFAPVVHQTFGSISYGATEFTLAKPHTVRLSYSMDYWIKIWVNGKVVKDYAPHGGPPSKGQFQVDVDMPAGPNEILVKVASGSLGNGFWLAVSDPGDLTVK